MSDPVSELVTARATDPGIVAWQLVARRGLLYPEDGDVAGAVDRAAAVVRG